MLVLLWQRMDQKIQSGRQFFHVTLLQDYHRRHELLRALPVVLVKEMSLYLMCWY